MKAALIVIIVLAIVMVGAVHFFAAKRERAAALAFPPTGQIVDVDGVAVHAVLNRPGFTGE